MAEHEQGSLADGGGPEQPLEIRVARNADYEQVAGLFGALHHFNAQLDSRFALAENWRELLRLHLEQNEDEAEDLWLLAYLDGRPVGLLLMEEHRDAPIFQHRYWAEVVALYVDEAGRGAGVARALLVHGYQWALARGLHCIQLYVTASNERARNFYQKEGFVETQAIMRKLLGSDSSDVTVPHTHRQGRLHFSEFGERPLDMHWREHQD